jgi:hypothetical protein
LFRPAVGVRPRARILPRHPAGVGGLLAGVSLLPKQMTSRPSRPCVGGAKPLITGRDRRRSPSSGRSTCSSCLRCCGHHRWGSRCSTLASSPRRRPSPRSSPRLRPLRRAPAPYYASRPTAVVARSSSRVTLAAAWHGGGPNTGGFPAPGRPNARRTTHSGPPTPPTGFPAFGQPQGPAVVPPAGAGPSQSQQPYESQQPHWPATGPAALGPSAVIITSRVRATGVQQLVRGAPSSGQLPVGTRQPAICSGCVWPVGSGFGHRSRRAAAAVDRQ